MKSVYEMTPDEVRAEAERRRELQRRGLPFETPTVRLLTPREQHEHDERIEKKIEHAGDRQMKALGFEVVKFSHPGRTKQTPGIPDRRYYHRQRMLSLWWEAKSATGRQRPEQRYFQEMCEACGETYVLGTDRDLFAWLVEHNIAAWTVGDLLVSLPFTPVQP